MREADIQAADYIVRLWGRRRREFARRYWLHLTYLMERPALDECFGAEGIEKRLDKIALRSGWEDRE